MKEVWTKKIKAIGFDLDGTLYNSPPEMTNWIAKQLVKKVAAHLGKEYDEVEEEYIFRRDKLGGNTLTLNSFEMNGELVFMQLFDEMSMDKYIQPENRLVELIESLRERYKLFIISNGVRRQIMKKLKYLKLEASMFVPLIACYDHEGWIKPQPAPFLAALEILECVPEEVVFVGDKIGTDIEGAKAVGMKTIYIGSSSKGVGSGVADINCRKLEEIEEIFA